MTKLPAHTTRKAEPTIDTGSIGERLIAVMDSLDQTFNEIGELTDKQRDAIRTLDQTQLGDLAARQSTLAQKVRSLQQDQRAIAGASMPEGARSRATLTDIAQSLPHPIKQRVLDRATSLRAHAAQVQRDNASVAQATQSLVRHMESLAQQVRTRFSAGGTYGTPNTHAPTVNRPHCLDVWS